MDQSPSPNPWKRRLRALLHALTPSSLNILRFLALAVVVLLITLLGKPQIPEKIATAKPIEFIGHADEASYALQGKSIAEGHGINVPYISTFFIPYPDTITHREDHWPPFMGYAIAPFFHYLGTETWVARLPGILFGSIGLPLTTALLAYALSRRSYVAIAAALLIMVNPTIYLHSMRTLSDVANAMLLAGFLGSVFLTRKFPWMHLPAGIFLACAYFSKGSEILLLALYPFFTLLTAGFPAFARRHFYIGLAAALLMMVPTWIANYRDYANPLHTTQNYVASFFGFDDWDTNFYKPYWGKNLPKLSDRWEKHPDYWIASRMQLPQVVRGVIDAAIEPRGYEELSLYDVWRDFGYYGVKTRELLAGPQALQEEKERGFGRPSLKTPSPIKPIADWKAPSSEFAFIAALALLAVAFAAIPLALTVQCLRLVKFLITWLNDDPQTRLNFIGPPPPKPIHNSHFWMIGPIVATWITILIHIAFIAFFWCYEPRFCFTALPLVIALCFTGLSRLIEWPPLSLFLAAAFIIRKIRRNQPFPRWIAPSQNVTKFAAPIFTLLLAGILLLYLTPIQEKQHKMLAEAEALDRFPYYDGIQKASRHIVMGKWLKKNLPDAIIMCRSPWELLFYCSPNNKGVGMPYPEDGGQLGAEQIFAIARYYHCQYIFIDEYRESLYAYMNHRRPGLKRVPGAPDDLYELDWSKLPKQTVNDLWPK